MMEIALLHVQESVDREIKMPHFDGVKITRWKNPVWSVNLRILGHSALEIIHTSNRRHFKLCSKLSHRQRVFSIIVSCVIYHGDEFHISKSIRIDWTR